MIKTVFWLSLAGVFTLSLLPGDQLPPQASLIWDKAQHAVGFLWLGIWGHAAYPRHTIKVLAGVLLAGLAIELAQALTTWRQGDLQDWLADAVGATAATTFWLAWRRLRGAWKG